MLALKLIFLPDGVQQVFFLVECNVLIVKGFSFLRDDGIEAFKVLFMAFSLAEDLLQTGFFLFYFGFKLFIFLQNGFDLAFRIERLSPGFLNRIEIMLYAGVKGCFLLTHGCKPVAYFIY